MYVTGEEPSTAIGTAETYTGITNLAGSPGASSTGALLTFFTEGENTFVTQTGGVHLAGLWLVTAP
jgi:hypothetical protein